MQCDRKAAQGGQGPLTQDRTNQENGTQNYLKKDLTRLRYVYMKTLAVFKAVQLYYYIPYK